MSVEQRQGARKILRAKAMLVMDGAGPVAARTLDVGPGGMSAVIAEPVPTGKKGKVLFELFYDGAAHIIEARVAVSHCIFSSAGFKVGLTFQQLDMAVSSAISKFMR
ncbi:MULTISPECIES: PilZ domain-containing protein [unclassified Janthinobacterium]|uniref:PilZ domain-containing protein n=1 Tax=unclassified Janthinobacterium TaxID=2610881 RepID=UPI0025B2EE34|nr:MULTISPECIES: PilZ domain-containing protein [unclassified Janthinobacterium]MDN2671088.1 PilZ domain-containing protein [Janthinobacterium sp. SUN026]MDN2675289.1 PilZ domain-containing protein [Janthinobacterium sp. SUN033]MDN2715330.1 PilZ domain-containing protein [Janthinobacterium sp. SUN120]